MDELESISQQASQLLSVASTLQTSFLSKGGISNELAEVTALMEDSRSRFNNLTAQIREQERIADEEKEKTEGLGKVSNINQYFFLA